MPYRHLNELEQIASLYRRRGKLRLAESLYRDLLSMQQSMLGRSSREVAMTLYNLGEIYCDQQQYERARKFYARSAEIWESIEVEPQSLLWYSDALLKLQQISDQMDEPGSAEQANHTAG